MFKKILNRFKSEEPLKIVEKKKIWFAIPVFVVVIAMIAFTIYAVLGGSFSKGLNFGIDFTGGTIMTVEIGESANATNFDANATKIQNIIIDNGMTIGYTQVSGEGANAAIVIKYTGDMNEADTEIANDAIKAAIQLEYPNIFVSNPAFIAYEYIGATTSNDLVINAIVSIIVASLLVLLYIIVRFEIYSGLSAVIALLNDVLCMIAFVTIFNIEINSYFIAVVITIIVYSINNTIVVFDRVRENLETMDINKKTSYLNVVNRSVTETIGRTVSTTVTTLCTITVLAIVGVPIIREFSLMIISGIVAGTFSSLCIAPSLYSLIRNKVYLAENDKTVVPKISTKNTSFKGKKS